MVAMAVELSAWTTEDEISAALKYCIDQLAARKKFDARRIFSCEDVSSLKCRDRFAGSGMQLTLRC